MRKRILQDIRRNYPALDAGRLWAPLTTGMRAPISQTLPGDWQTLLRRQETRLAFYFGPSSPRMIDSCLRSKDGGRRFRYPSVTAA